MTLFPWLYTTYGFLVYGFLFSSYLSGLVEKSIIITVILLLAQGYKQLKAKLGMRKVRPWKWMPFTNPARSDGAVFNHWRRIADEGKEYPFAKFNKVIFR